MNRNAVLFRIIFKKHSFRSSLYYFSFSSSSLSKFEPFQSLYNFQTCITTLQSCAHHQNLTKGKQLHSYMITSGFLRSPASITSLINMYSKCNQMNEALLIFNDPFQDRNVFAYNALIAGFTANGLNSDGFQLYKRMRLIGVMPDKFTLPCVIRACNEVIEVNKIHGFLFKLGLEFDMFVGSALVNTYLRFGLMNDALQMFDELPVRDVVLWNAMVNGYSQIGQFDEALEVFRRMVKEGIVPSRFTATGVLSIFAVMGDFKNGIAIHGFVIKMGYDSGVAVSNALIDMYGKCKCIDDALVIFEIMDEKDIFSWNSILASYEQCGDHDGTLKLFDRMLCSNVRPDLITVTIVLPACSHLAALVHGREIHAYMIANDLQKDTYNKDSDDVLMNNALIDMYAKCGSMRSAHMVFNTMRNKDVASWNIIIMGYGLHGYGTNALDMFSRMCEAQIKPDEVSFVGVLSACSHSGLVDQGRMLFRQMKSEFGVNPTIEHYTCVIDMLGRAGNLEEAYELARTMPIQANSVVWRALLAACRVHGNVDLAKVAAKHVIELDPEHCGSYVLMSNVYGVIGRYEEVLGVRDSMKEQNVQKRPGCSWIELKNGVHAFITRDKTHPESNFLYDVLNSLTARLHEYGYVPNG